MSTQRKGTVSILASLLFLGTSSFFRLAALESLHNIHWLCAKSCLVDIPFFFLYDQQVRRPDSSSNPLNGLLLHLSLLSVPSRRRQRRIDSLFLHLPFGKNRKFQSVSRAKRPRPPQVEPETCINWFAGHEDVFLSLSRCSAQVKSIKLLNLPISRRTSRAAKSARPLFLDYWWP